MSRGKLAFHPVVARYLEQRFPTLTEIQKKALPLTLSGENTLILAPTGSGKTLAAFLSVLDGLARMAHGPGLPNSICAIYVSPLKALGRDMLRNLEPLLEAINEGLPETKRIRMDLRSGDTDFADRSRQQRRRPHLLLTTPESLSSLLSQSGYRDRGFLARWIIVDEIHALAENKRGSLLALAMERLEVRVPEPPQRIGLSATAWPVEVVARLLGGDRPCAVASVDLRRAHHLDIAAPDAKGTLPPAGYNPFRIAHTVAALVERARCSLVFTATRSGAERLGLALKILLPELDEKIAVHHGSIEREKRHEVETGLAEGRLRAVVCSTSLELGVDYSSVDQVLLIGAPRGVSRAMQRLGRSGHRVGGVAKGSLVPLSLPDLIECIALRQAASDGKLDPLRVPAAPLDVLAQVLLGMSIEQAWHPDDAYALVRRSGPYGDLRRTDFDAVLQYLGGGGKVLQPYGTYGKIVFLEDGRFQIASRKAAQNFYWNAGVISDEYQVRVLLKGNRRLGEVEESFLASLQPGEAFILGGRSVAVKRLHQNTALVEPAHGERVKTPRWMGGRMPLSGQLAQEELRLRRQLREAWDHGGATACRETLRRHWGVDEEAAGQAALLIERQYKAMPIPIDSPVEIESIEQGRTLQLLFHVVAGRAVNRSLAWVMGHRLSRGSSVVANFDDHCFLLALDARRAPTEEEIRAGFDPRGWREDLERVVATTETLGRKFRAIAEVGMLLQRKTGRGPVSARSASWSGSLLYRTLLEHEPEHPLVREAAREVIEDQCDARTALAETERIFACPFEIHRLPRPSPFGLALFAAFNRDTLLAQDPDKAVDDLAAALFEEWVA